MKEYINRLEARVQKLEDSGYAQFVEYHVQVPEMNTIRFSYCSHSLLKMVETRDMHSISIASQLMRR